MIEIFKKMGNVSKFFLDRIKKLFKPDLLSWLTLVIIFVAPAFFMTAYLYNFPFKKVPIDINNFSKKEYFIFSKVDDQIIRTFFGKIFQTSLSLDWYDFCLINKNNIFINGKPFDFEEMKEMDSEAGAMELVFTSNEPKATSSFYVPLNNQSCRTLSLGTEPSIELKELSLRRPEKFSASISVETSEKGINLGPIEIKLDSNRSSAYIKNNFLAWILKFFVIFISWSAFILFLKRLLEFVKD